MGKAIRLFPLLLIFFLFSCQSLRNALPMDRPEDRAQSALIILGNPPGTYPVTNDDIPQLLEYTRDPNPAVRHMAVFQLGQLKTASFYNDMIPLLLDSDISVARNTEELLLRNRDAAAEVFRNNLKSDNKELVLKLLDYLILLNDRDSLPLVIELFLSPDKEIVDKAVAAASRLADINDRILFDTLLRPETAIRAGIVRTLGNMSDPAVLGTLLPYLYDPDVKVQNAVKFAFINFGNRSVPYLLNVLKNPVPRTQLAVLGLFEALKDPETLIPMIELFGNENSRIREGAIHTVLTFGADAIKPLGESLEGSSEQTVLAIIDLFGQIKNTDALPYLLPLLDNESENIRNKAYETILLFGSDAGDLFLKILDRRSTELYTAAVKGLMKLGDIRLVTDSNTSLYNRNARNMALLTISDFSDLETYLRTLSVSALLVRDFLSIKEIDNGAKALIASLREINRSGSRYTTYYISRNEYLKKSEDAMKLSFSHMHSYMESRDPKDLESARQERINSDVYKEAADNLETELENYTGSTEKEKQLIGTFEASRDRIISLYDSVSINRKNLADEILLDFNLTYDRVVSGNFTIKLR